MLTSCGNSGLTVTNPQLLIQVTPTGTLTIDEGDSTGGTLQVKLSRAPTANVTVTLAKTNTDVTLDPASLTFTSSNWSTAQAVTVTATDDSDTTDETDTITFSASGGITASNATTKAVSITDDDSTSTPTGTIQVTPTGTLTIDEGDSTGGTLSVSLSATTAPTANVTVALTKTNTDVTLSPTSLTFTASNYSQAQTVTVTAAEDSDTTHETDTITFSASGGITAPNVTKAVHIYDDEGPGYDITPASLTIAEGGQATFQVRLKTQPTRDLNISVDKSSALVEIDIDPDTAGRQDGLLRFNQTNQTKIWSEYRTIAVFPKHDSDMNDESTRIRLFASVSGDYSIFNTPSVLGIIPITITDDDKPTPAGTIQVTPAGTLTIDEGDSTGGTFQVSLSAAPTANVTVSLAKTNTDVTLSPTSLTFTASNHSRAQTVTVTAAEDNDTTHETDTITFSASGGITAPNVTKSVSITDDDKPAGAIQVTPAGTLSIDEGDSTGGTLSVTLSARPNADVTVALAKTNDDVTLSPTSLTFTSSNHSNGQTVTVTAAEDDDADDDSDTITFSATGGITASNVTKSISIDDDEPTPGAIQVSPAGTLNIDEGSSGELKVKLSTAPESNVTVTLSKTNDDVTLSGATLSASALTFTTSNYGTEQTVTVSAAEDGDQNSESDTITFTATGGITASNVTKAVAIADNDAPAGTIDVSPAGTLDIDEGGSGTFTVKIGGGPPNANVTVSLTSSDTDVTLSPASLTFTTGNYQNTQPVTATAAEDNDTDYETVTITLSATGGINASNVTKTVEVSDNDKPAGTIVISPTGTLDIDEGDSTGGSFTVELGAKPNANVTVSLTSSNSDVTLAPASLTFTESNYDTAQPVTVTAGEDGDADDDTATITLSASGGIDASNVTKSVAIDDDEPTPGAIQVSPAGTLRIDEGGSGELEIKLSAAPESSVTVTLSKSNDDVTLSGSTLSGSALTFTTSNYSTAQTVTVTAAEDGDTNDDRDTITFSASGGITASDVAKRIVITDDDAPPLPTGTIQITPTGTLNIDEGDSAGGVLVVSLAVSSAPTTNVTVSLAKTNADVTLSPTSLVFTSSNHSTAQMVTVIAAEDDDAINDADTITFTASGGIDAPQATKRIAIADNDSPPPPPGPGPSGPRGAIQIVPSGTLKINEGDSREISVSLSAAPVGRATVFFSKDNTDITLSSTSLTFDASNYEVAQPLTITAAHDDDAEDDYDTIVARATGGIVAPDARHPVHIADDDFPPGTILIEPAGTLNIREGDSRAFTLRLSHRPKDDVVVTLSIPDGAPIELDAQSFVFTTLDWGDERTVIVSAVHDANAASESFAITLSASGGIDAPDVEVLVEVEDDEPLPPVRSRALAFPPADAQDSATLRVRCKQDAPCTVLLDCHAQADGSAFEGALPEAIPAWGAVTLTAEDIEGHTGASWAGKGRLGCALRSQGNLSAQVWTRSSDGVLVNNSAFIRSEPEGNEYRADIESIPEPESAEKSNLRIRCDAPQGETCTATRLSCYDDAGNRYDGALGSIEPRQVRHLQAAGLADIIGHRWQGMGLSCEMRSNAPFTVQVLTRTGSGGALVNNSASGAR